MLLINKNYFSLICGGGRGRYSKLQKMADAQRECEEQILMLIKGLTLEDAHKVLPFIPVCELSVMFKLDAEGHIIAPRLSGNNVSSLVQALSDHNKVSGRL